MDNRQQPTRDKNRYYKQQSHNTGYDYDSEMADYQAELEKYRQQRAEREHYRRKLEAMERRRRKQIKQMIRLILCAAVVIVIVCIVVSAVKNVKENRAEKAVQETQLQTANNDESKKAEANDSDGNSENGSNEGNRGDLDGNQNNVAIPNLTEEELMASDEYPDELKTLYQNNEEARDFVMAFPVKKGTVDRSPLDEYEDCTSVPLLIQWDERWGYYEFGNSVFAVSGCGPTCLSMIAIYITHDTELTPLAIADFAVENGYYKTGSGSSWTLMEDGARELGLTVKEINPEEGVVAANLEAGYPIICNMGPGDFTKEGHYIVLTSYESGTVLINDPNSVENSLKRWNYEDIKDQIKNIWVYVPE